MLQDLLHNIIAKLRILQKVMQQKSENSECWFVKTFAARLGAAAFVEVVGLDLVAQLQQKYAAKVVYDSSLSPPKGGSQTSLQITLEFCWKNQDKVSLCEKQSCRKIIILVDCAISHAAFLCFF